MQKKYVLSHLYKPAVCLLSGIFILLISCGKDDPLEEKKDVVKENEQLLNGGFEDWEGSGKEAEPAHWNSFMSAEGSGMAYDAGKSQQVRESSDIRPGSSGKKSVCIYARSVLGVIANGNLTTGRIHIGSVKAESSNNYNITRTVNSDYHQLLTSKPDSIRFWAKFVCEDKKQCARMNAVIHDSCDYRDPETSGMSSHVVAKTECEFSTQNGDWKCYTVPFDYDYPSTEARYILLTFTTNKVAGKGGKDDELYVDDVELIYSESNKAAFPYLNK